MKTNRFHDLRDYQFAKGEKLIFDTNVWLYIFPQDTTSSTGALRAKYMASFNAIRAGGKIFLDAFVLSEYLNRYARSEWEWHNRNQKQAVFHSYKDFRNSPFYDETVAKTLKVAGKLSAYCERVDILFTQYDFERLLIDHSRGVCDFNDSVLMATCRHHGYKLVTHDADFAAVDYDLDILTHNARLFS